MSYSYLTQKPYIFTEQGSRDLLRMHDWIQKLLKDAGAFKFENALDCKGLRTCVSWEIMALAA